MSVRLEPGPLVLASHNEGKVRELRTLVEPFGFHLQSAAELDLDEPEETGTTFGANAIIKAEAAAASTGLPALADDSGLAVDGLNGDPGIYSARWAGPKKDFSQAMRLVEERLQASGPVNRGAEFICALALAIPGQPTETYQGVVRGTLVWPPRGDQGFGYDPMFLPDGFSITFGEMSAEEKHGWAPGESNPLSHRARAFQAFHDAVLANP